MKKKIRILLITQIMIFGSLNIQSQSCPESYRNALELYNQGYVGYVHEILQNCLTDFYYNRATYLYPENHEVVFKVYKLEIVSYYAEYNYYMGDLKKKELVDFFYGIYDHNYVISKLDQTIM